MQDGHEVSVWLFVKDQPSADRQPVCGEVGLTKDLFVSAPQSENSNVSSSTQAAGKSFRGRWKWGLAVFVIAWIAQGILWTMWWDDPTHFKMSILFVWPAALFLLTIWWAFFSGWSSYVRFGLLGAIAVGIGAFFSLFRMEWDGDMVPRRISLRSSPRAEDVARNFLKAQTSSSATPQQPDESSPSESAPLVATESDWPGFRGPHRDGIVRGGILRRDWDSNRPREVWRHPVGRAWSAFSIVGDYAFTQEQRDEYESVVAYDLNSGQQRWIHQDKALLSITEVQGGPGPHGTPQFDDGLIYTLGGTGLLNCLDAVTGKLIWGTDILKDAGSEKLPGKPPEWGVSNSPLIVDNLVIVIPGGSAVESDLTYDKGVAAYDKKSGKIVWSKGKHAASYGSPRVFEVAGVRQLLIPNANGLSGVSIENGDELWFFPLENAPKVNSSMPWVLDDGSVFYGTGYGVGSVLLDVKRDEEKWTVDRRWASNRFRPKFNDFVVRDNYAYGLDDGTLTCLDLAKGTVKWKAGRYGYGQLILLDDLLILMAEDGDLKLIPATPSKPEESASIKIFDSGFCWNQLAFSRGHLLLRNANEAVYLDVRDNPTGN